MLIFPLLFFFLALATPGAKAEALTGAEVIAAVTTGAWDAAVANTIVVTINDAADNFNFEPADLN